MRGRPPKPVELQLIEGRRVSKKKQSSPKPKKQTPICPSWLCDKAKSEWKYIVPELDRLGLLTKIDRAALVSYCESYAQYRTAMEWIHKNGTHYPLWERDQKTKAIVRDGEGKPILRYMQQVPQVSIANKAFQNIKACSSMFGLSPSDRGRMSVPGAEDKEDSMEQMFQERRKMAGKK